MKQSVDLSVVIVNYKVRDLLAQTIRSLRTSTGYEQCEVIVVDNDSNDGSEELIINEFPEVIWIGLKTNVGFGKGCNIGAEQASGKYLLMLNPDTIVSTDTLQCGIEFMESHPDVGIMGPKILNQDGSFYKQCHRGLPTPLNAFGHFTKLSRLFPHNKKLSSYFMTWLSPDEEHEVEAISGSCFFIPAVLYTQIGGFDETFFMYGEDLDICVQVKKAGLKVWYAPITEIIHFQGKSSAQRVFRSRIAFYNAMILFSRKYSGSYGSFFPPVLIEFAVVIQALLSFLLIFSKQIPALILDLVTVNALIVAITSIRFEFLPKSSPYIVLSLTHLFTIHSIAMLSLITPFFISDILNKDKKSYLKACTVGLGIFLSTLFLTHSLSFSRMSLLISGVLSTATMVSWRVWLPKFSSFFDKVVNKKQKTILISEEPLLSKVVDNFDIKKLDIIGVISTDSKNSHQELAGYPVLGVLDSLSSLVSETKADHLIIVSNSDWYSTLIQNLSSGALKNISIQWLPPHNPLSELKEFTLK